MDTDSFRNRQHYKTFRRRRSLRLPDFDYSQSRAYHVTWGTHERQPILAREALAREIIDVLEERAGCDGVTVFTYCLMPDHIHLLLCPEQSETVTSFVQGFKSKTTRTYWHHGGRDRLWQRGFFDHILRRDEDLESVANYILGNPVRAGCVDTPEEYPFSGCVLPSLPSHE